MEPLSFPSTARKEEEEGRKKNIHRVIIARLDIDLFIRYQIGSHCTGTDRLSLIVNVTLPEPCQPKEI